MSNNQPIINVREKRVQAVLAGHQVPAVQAVITPGRDTHTNKIVPWVKPSTPQVTGVANYESNPFYQPIFINFNVYQSINHLFIYKST